MGADWGPDGTSIEDLLSPCSATPQEVQDAVLRSMGEDVPAARRREPGPDVSGLAREIGLHD